MLEFVTVGVADEPHTVAAADLLFFLQAELTADDVAILFDLSARDASVPLTRRNAQLIRRALRGKRSARNGRRSVDA